MRRSDQERVNDITRIPARTGNDIEEALKSHLNPLKDQLLDHNTQIYEEITYLKVSKKITIRTV